MAAPGSQAGTAEGPRGGGAAREATGAEKLGASPGPELSPLEPGPSPLAVGKGPRGSAIPSKTCFLLSLGVLPSGMAGGGGHCGRQTKYPVEKKSGARRGCGPKVSRTA